MAPVRFSSVTVHAWHCSSGSGFSFPAVPLGKRSFLCISVQVRGMARFRFRFGSDGSDFGSCWEAIYGLIPVSWKTFD